MNAALVKRLIPDVIRQSVGQSRRYAARPGLASAQIWPIGEAIAALAPLKAPPILLLSLPRGGSSWAGRILGGSEGSLYLHEPVTQSYLKLIGGKGASEFEYAACRDHRGYDRFLSLAFRGIPRFHESVVLFPEQWSAAARRGRRVVVKEVNPLALDVMVERFRPRVVYLLRHPVAVARSYEVLGWSGTRKFHSRFTPATLARLEQRFQLPYDGSSWEQSGALQAIAQHLTLASLAAAAEHTVVRYEDLCADPMAEFARLFEFCELPFSATVRDAIARSTRSDGPYRPGGSDIARDTREMIDRWRHEVEPAHIAEVRRGYLANQPTFYRDDADW